MLGAPGFGQPHESEDEGTAKPAAMHSYMSSFLRCEVESHNESSTTPKRQVVEWGTKLICQGV